MKKLQSIGKSVTTDLAKIFTGSTRIISSTPKKITPHIAVHNSFTIEELPRKADYLPDILSLIHDYHLSVDQISKFLHISSSYIYKLIRK